MAATSIPAPDVWRIAPPHPQGLAGLEAATAPEIGATLAAASRMHGPRVALTGADGPPITYAELHARARAAAYAVTRVVPAGGTIAVLLPHTTTGAVGYLGCYLSTRLTLAINPADPADRLAALLREARPDVILIAEDAPWPGGAAIGLPESTRLLRPSDLLGTPAPAGWEPPDALPDAPGMIHFTSGSTGTPKGLVLSRHSIGVRALGYAASCSLTAQDVTYAASGSYLASGFSFLFGTLLNGSTLLCAGLATEGAGGVFRLMRREQPTTVVANAAITRMLLALPGSAACFARTRNLRMGAMGLLRADCLAIRAALPPGATISHTYASTEAQMVAEWDVSDPPPPDSAIPGGWLRAGQHYALLDPAGRPVADGEAGELVLRGRRIALGEWRDGRVVPGRMVADPEDPTRRIFRTGDVMRLGADGLLRFVGRADRQININGVRIEPSEIEAVLRRLPAVREAAVVPGPSGRPVAYVAAPDATGPGTADPDAADALRKALAARVRESLPTAMWPETITVLPALPMLSAGKIDLMALRRLAAVVAPGVVAPAVVAPDGGTL